MEVILEDAVKNTRFFDTSGPRYGRLIVNKHVSPPGVMVIVMEEGQKVEPVFMESINSNEVDQYLFGEEPATSLIHKVLSSIKKH